MAWTSMSFHEAPFHVFFPAYLFISFTNFFHHHFLKTSTTHTHISIRKSINQPHPNKETSSHIHHHGPQDDRTQREGNQAHVPSLVLLRRQSQSKIRHPPNKLPPPIPSQKLNLTQINFKKLSDMAGYTNVGSCTNAWSAIKKKLAAQKESDGTASSNGDSSAKATPKKRGKKAAAEEEHEGVDDEESPAKRIKATPRKRAATPKKLAKSAESEDEEHVVKTEKVEDGEMDADALV
jgi:hypothetical protein